MIARFRVLLPFRFSVRHGDELTPYEYLQGGYRVRVYPPRQSAVNPADLEVTRPVPVFTLIEQLAQDRPPDVTDAVTMNGAPTIQADLLQIDFLKAEFDRRKAILAALGNADDAQTAGDPPISLAFAAANNFLGRVRTVTQGAVIRSLSPGAALWELDYLTDNEKPLPVHPEMFRKRMGSSFTWRLSGINSEVWERVRSLPESFTPATWDTLLLDAEAALPQVGSAIVLAYAALETLIESSLNELASRSSVPVALWKWINERQGDDRLTPSVGEQFDIVLHGLTGRSLKENPNLWEAFQNLRGARNSYLHEGKAVIGKQKEEVTVVRATALVAQAKAIVDWVESILPLQLRRPKVTSLIQWNLIKTVAAPASTTQPPTQGVEG